MNELQHIAESLISTDASTRPSALSSSSTQQIIDCSAGIGRDYELFLESNRQSCELIDLDIPAAEDLTTVVLFIEDEISECVLKALRWVVKAALLRPMRCVVVVEGVALHFGDHNAQSLEAMLLDDLKRHVSSLVIIRTGFVVSQNSATSRWLRRCSAIRCLLPTRMTSTFLDGDSLFSIINAEVHQASETWESSDSSSNIGDETRSITVLGRRRSWRDVANQFQSSGVLHRLFNVAAVTLSWIGASWLIFFVVVLAGKLLPSLRQYHFHTLKPRSTRELVSLYNRHNCGDVQIAGYNNGVNHFGWKYPDKTVVLTTSIPGDVQFASEMSESASGEVESSDSMCGDMQESGKPRPQLAGHCFAADGAKNSLVIVDAGLTLNRCIKELNKVDREFYVVPNYSWISMGTLFFVPVHGSGSRVSTLGDTIENVLLYDGDNEKYLKAHRGDDIFRNVMYDRNHHWLLLKLTLRVKPKSKYYVRRSKLESPSADDIQKLFNDPQASNVEIRKNQAASTAISVSHYYIDTNEGGSDTMEMPRDSIGRIWDRLEETPVVSTLFHWFVKTFAFHVELFLRPDEFAVFWNHHQSLPVSKIQLRRVFKDGITHSACENSDCISADLFMTRRNRDVFCKFIAAHLPDVRTNPGKQSF